MNDTKIKVGDWVKVSIVGINEAYQVESINDGIYIIATTEGTYTHKIKIEDNVYKRLKQATQVKGMTGNISGIIDNFIIKLIESIDKGLIEEHFKYKNEKK